MVLPVLASSCSEDSKDTADAGDTDSDTDADTDTDSDTDTDTDTDTDSDTDVDTGPHECGDGEVWDEDCGAECEACDDGDTIGGDFCSADCGTAGWHTFYGSSGSDSGLSVAIDASGNIFVTGFSDDSWNGPGGESPLHAHSGDANVFVMKMSGDGAYQWHTFFGSASSISEGDAIALDGDGNIYVSGEATGSWNGPGGEAPLHAYSGDWDVLVLKLSPSGIYQWHTFYGSDDVGGGGWGDGGRSVAVDGDCNVYVTGYSNQTWNGPTGESPLQGKSGTSETSDLFALKLSSSGAYQWHTFHGASSDDGCSSVAIGGGGDIFISGWAGESWNGPSGESPLNAYSGGYENLLVLKLSASGAYQWHTYYGPASEGSEGRSIAIGGSGDIFVTGSSDESWNGPGGESPLHAHSDLWAQNLVVLVLNPSGAYQWHTFFGAQYSWVSGASIAVDGDIYVTGYSDDSWTGPSGEGPLHALTASSDSTDLFVLKMSSAGAYLWHTFYGSSSDESGESIAVDNDGGVFVTGDSGQSWNGPDGQSPLHGYSSGDRETHILKLAQ